MNILIHSRTKSPSSPQDFKPQPQFHSNKDRTCPTSLLTTPTTYPSISCFFLSSSTIKIDNFLMFLLWLLVSLYPIAPRSEATPHSGPLLFPNVLLVD